MIYIKPKRIRWAGHGAHMGEKSNEYRVLEDKPEEKCPLGRFGHRWENDIKMGLK